LVWCNKYTTDLLYLLNELALVKTHQNLNAWEVDLVLSQYDCGLQQLGVFCMQQEHWTVAEVRIKCPWLGFLCLR